MRVFKSDEFMADDTVIYVHPNEAVKDYPVHTHDFIEIIYILDGEGIQTIDGTSYSVRRGDMLFINYGSSHSYSTSSRFEYREIFFSPKLFGDGAITASNALALLAK